MRWRDRQFDLNDECPSCGRIMHLGGKMDDALCTVDHIIPTAADGEDEEWNWGLLCRKCNCDKGDYYPADARDE